MGQVDDLRAAGFGEDDVTQWVGKERERLTGAGFNDQEVNEHLGIRPDPELSKPFLNRLMAGTRAEEYGRKLVDFGKRVGGAAAEGAKIGWGTEPLGFSDKSVDELSRLGFLHPESAARNPLHLANDAVLYQGAKVADGLMRGLNSVVSATGAYGGALLDEIVGHDPTKPSEGQGLESKIMHGIDALTGDALKLGVTADARHNQSFKQDMMVMAQHAALLLGSGAVPTIETPRVGPNGLPEYAPVGSARVTAGDVSATARVFGDGAETPLLRGKVEKLYADHGLHPAEVVHDAQSDPVAAQNMISRDPTTGPTETGLMDPNAKDTKFGNNGGKPPAPPEEPPSKEVGPPLPPEDSTLADAQKKILDHMSINESNPKRGFNFDRLYEQFVDRFWPLEKEVRESVIKPEGTSEDPYRMVRLYAGWAGKADHMIEKGMFDFHTYENTGPGLRAILDPVKDDLNGFRAFIASARAKELQTRGIQTGFDPEAVQIVGAAGIKKYGAAFKQLVEYQNGVSKYLRDSGVLNDKAYAAMLEANRLFVPFHRVMGDDEAAWLGGGLQARNPIKKIEGSGREVIDPVESIIKNTYLLTQMAEKNVVGTKLVNLLLENEAHLARAGRAAEIEKLPLQLDKPNKGREVDFLRDGGMGHNGPPSAIEDLAAFLRDMGRGEGPGEIGVFYNGKREVYNVGEDLARAMKAMSSDTAGLIERAMAPFANTLRAGAVLDPSFAARHLMRDAIYAFVTTKEGVFTPMDMAKGLIGNIVKDADYWNWMKSGGGQVSIVSLDRAYMQDKIADLAQAGMFTRSWNVVVDPNATWLQKGKAIVGLPIQPISKYAIHPLQVITELALSSSHLGAFKKSMRRQEAAAPRIEPTLSLESPPKQIGFRSTVPAIAHPEGLPADGTQYMLRPGYTMDNAFTTDSAGKKMMLEAAWTSRDTAIDAQRMGTQMKTINSISVFANAKIQDTAVVLKMLKDNPVRGTIMVSAAITLPSVLMWAAFHDDSRYKELPPHERDTFWHFFTDKWEEANNPALMQQASERPPDQVMVVNGRTFLNNGTIFRYPKPFGAGVAFGSTAERLLDLYDGTPYAMKGLSHALLDATVGDLVPTAVAPILDQAMNRSGFTGRTLIPRHMEKRLPEYQYLPYTTEIAKKLGKITSAFPGVEDWRLQEESTGFGGFARALTSPIMIENYVRGWSGGLGTMALHFADWSGRKAGLLDDTANRAPMGLTDIPVVKAFVTRYPSATVKSVSEFYEAAGHEKMLQATIRAQAREGNLEAVQRVMAMQPLDVKLGEYTKAIGDHSKMIQMIDSNPKMEPYEKRQLIDGYYYSMIRIAQQGNEMLAQIRKAKEKQP